MGVQKVFVIRSSGVSAIQGFWNMWRIFRIVRCIVGVHCWGCLLAGFHCTCVFTHTHTHTHTHRHPWQQVGLYSVCAGSEDVQRRDGSSCDCALQVQWGTSLNKVALDVIQLENDEQMKGDMLELWGLAVFYTNKYKILPISPTQLLSISAVCPLSI